MVVTITNTLKVVAADPDDDKVLEWAVVGGATHVVTGDRRRFPRAGLYAVTRLTPCVFPLDVPTCRDWLARLYPEQAAAVANAVRG